MPLFSQSLGKSAINNFPAVIISEYKSVAQSSIPFLPDLYFFAKTELLSVRATIRAKYTTTLVHGRKVLIFRVFQNLKRLQPKGLQKQKYITEVLSKTDRAK